MGYDNFSGQYQKTNIATASKVGLVVLCYEKAIQSIKLTRMHYEQNEYEAKANTLLKAIQIINELQSSLDKEKGGAIAENLDNIYSYLTRKLVEGDIKKDLSIFDEAVNILSELKEAWDFIAAEEKQNAPSVPNSDSINIRTTQVAA